MGPLASCILKGAIVVAIAVEEEGMEHAITIEAEKDQRMLSLLKR